MCVGMNYILIYVHCHLYNTRYSPAENKAQSKNYFSHLHLYL